MSYYMQITTKCNMKCAHCCYSCNMKGKHMTKDIWTRAIEFIRERDELISIGGGEPTLHPDFFSILGRCIRSFAYVWLATNGSRTEAMWRLANILDECDFESFDCTCKEEYLDSCRCYEDAISLERVGHLGVALSQDPYHDPIDPRIVDKWNSRVNAKRPGYEIRNVSISHRGVIDEGRAKRTGVGRTSEGCVCNSPIIRPDGQIKLCGCRKSPIIGDVIYGISSEWEDIMRDDEGYRDSECYKKLNT